MIRQEGLVTDWEAFSHHTVSFRSTYSSAKRREYVVQKEAARWHWASAVLFCIRRGQTWWRVVGSLQSGRQKIVVFYSFSMGLWSTNQVSEMLMYTPSDLICCCFSQLIRIADISPSWEMLVALSVDGRRAWKIFPQGQGRPVADSMSSAYFLVLLVCLFL